MKWSNNNGFFFCNSRIVFCCLFSNEAFRCSFLSFNEASSASFQLKFCPRYSTNIPWTFSASEWLFSGCTIVIHKRLVFDEEFCATVRPRSHKDAVITRIEIGWWAFIPSCSQLDGISSIIKYLRDKLEKLSRKNPYFRMMKIWQSISTQIIVEGHIYCSIKSNYWNQID